VIIVESRKDVKEGEVVPLKKPLTAMASAHQVIILLDKDLKITYENIFIYLLELI